MDCHFQNRGEGMPEQPSWALIAPISTAAPVYEWANLAGIGSSLVTPRNVGAYRLPEHSA